MPAALIEANQCCTPCEEPTTIQVPGTPGAAGATGTAGTNGVNAYTNTTAAFTMPAEGGTTSVQVVDTAWMVVGQTLYVQTAGYMTVSSITNSITVVLLNPENTASSAYASNAAPATSIPSNSKVAPAGIQGPSGALSGAASGDLEGNYPGPNIAITTTKGDLIVNNNAAVAPRNTRLAVGTNGNVLRANSATGTGLEWGAVNVAGGVNHIVNALPIANGGTGQATQTAGFDALSPTTTRGDIIRRGAAVNERVGPTVTGQVAQFNGTDTIFDKLSSANLGAALGRLTSDYILLRDEKATTVNGGGFTSAAWQTHALTTEVVDTGAHSVLAANQVTLSAGTYRFRGRAIAYKVDNHQIRLQNITAGTTTAYGTNARAAAAGDDSTMSEVEGRFTIAGATVFELQHRCATTRATDGFGAANSFGGTEVYASLEFWREAV